ncbi:MAG: alpha-amylase/4-alpha-glucanotransferase domain-containing protein [Candidatus Dormibacteria bacterium]
MPESPPRLSLVVHFHQPVGNLDGVVARATSRCYLPFLKTIAEHPEVPWTLHYSGCLLRWLVTNAPEVPERLAALVDAGVVELLTGGLEEPILASIPERDGLSQIARMSEMLRERFGVTPTGLWLTERVWEPNLARTLARAGVSYTVVDDTSLKAVGVEESVKAGPWSTYFESERVMIVGSSRQLRYLIPYARPDRVISEIAAVGPDGLIVYADDGEKFGEWPRTHRQVYGRRWLSRFLDSVTVAAADDRVRLVKLAEAVEGGPKGRVYLPSGSYDEMMTWALPTPARHRLEAATAGLAASSDPAGVGDFVRGAPWHGFLAKYPEVARLHQAMLRVSAKVERAGNPPEAIAHLHMAQCNCGYWHGTFGGAYLSFLRLALWHHLVVAEHHADQALGGPTGAGSDLVELDADGGAEVRLRGPWGYASVAPGRGGQVTELVSWKGAANLVAVMGRHQESYHLPSEPNGSGEAQMELGILEAPSAASVQGLEFDLLEVGALRDSLDGISLDYPYRWEPVAGGMVLRWESQQVTLEKVLRVVPTGLEATYLVTPRQGRWSGDLGVEVRSCPLALGRTADAVRARPHNGRWVVDQPGSVSALAVSTDDLRAPDTSRLIALGATLNGLEEMAQGMRLEFRWEVDATSEHPWERRILLEPVATNGSGAPADRSV